MIMINNNNNDDAYAITELKPYSKEELCTCFVLNIQSLKFYQTLLIL